MLDQESAKKCLHGSHPDLAVGLSSDLGKIQTFFLCPDNGMAASVWDC